MNATTVPLKQSEPADPRCRGLTAWWWAKGDVVGGVILVSAVSAGVEGDVGPRGVFDVDTSTTPGALPLNDFLKQGQHHILTTPHWVDLLRNLLVGTETLTRPLAR